MSRLIDADALWMDVIRSVDYCDDILEFIERQPTVEQSHWIPCSEYPEYDFEDVLIRWHDKRKGCEDDYILCEGYVVRKHWCCIFEDADMSDYEPVEWMPLPSPYQKEGDHT